jgi:Activator of Hsp90 ATPase homolog 1-like protein
MGQWWPKEHHIGGSPMLAVVVEPRNGGRWYEKDEDGSECDWGTVLDWQPPTRVVFSWHLNGNFEYAGNNRTFEDEDDDAYEDEKNTFCKSA